MSKLTTTGEKEAPVSTALVRAASALPIAGMSDIAGAGDLLAQAGFLGCRNAGEGFVVMAVCQQTGISLIEFQQRYHFRQGRFSIQAHALLAEFVGRGGTYKVLERSPSRAAIELSKDGNTYLSEVTWDQAAAEPFVYRGDESEALAELAKPADKRRLKAKYQTPRSRMQMLWARALSDGVVVVDPGARGGVYTSEETEDFAPASSREPQPITVEEAVARTAATATAPTETQRRPPAAKASAEVCPFPGPMFGLPWQGMTDEHLALALEVDHPDFTAAHRKSIESILAERRIMGGK